MESDKFCLAKKDTGALITGGCHDTRKEAVDQIRAILAKEAALVADSSTVELHLTNVESALSHLYALKALHDGIAAGTTPITDDVKTEFDQHIHDALEALGAGVDVDKEHEEGEDVDVPELVTTFDSDADVEEFAWEGPIAFEEVLTGDKRIFKAGSIEWDIDTLPWAFRWQKASTGGHSGAVPIGRVDRLERQDDGSIKGFGVIIPSLNEEAAEYLRLLKAGVASGVSVDGDTATFDVVEGITPEDSRVEFSSMRVRSLTAVDIPAFANAKIQLCGSLALDVEDVELAAKKKKKKARMRARVWRYASDDTLTAAAIPVKPPIEWFEDPKFDEPAPITVTKEGQVYGHLALFNSCHIGFPGCVKPPRGNTYTYFHTGELETAEGDLVEVGKLTFNTGHASMADSAKVAASHYDNTGSVAADVRSGEDQYGIWVAGALRPSLTDEDIRVFRSAPLSGDWRRIAGRLELVGCLAVNVPGFPVPRARVLVASGETETLIHFYQEDPITEYERKLRFEAKANLAFQVALQAEDADLPTRESIEKEAKGLTPAQVREQLVLVRELLDDPDEYVPDREKVEAFYKQAAAALENKEEFHLVGQHDQSDHGGGGGGGGHARSEHKAVRAEEKATRITSWGRKSDPLNHRSKTSKEARGKASRAKKSSKRWAALALVSLVVPGLGVVSFGSSLAVSVIRAKQARAHDTNASNLERQGK